MKTPIIAAVSLFLVGCATSPTVQLSESDKSAVKTVTIAPVVSMPKEMFFSGRAQAVSAGVGGALGAIIGGALAKKEPQGQLAAVMEAKAISIPEIVKAEFGNQLINSGRMRIVPDKANADGEVSLAVNMYGLGQTQGLSSLLYPVINVTATLTRSDGSVAWRRTDFVTPHNSNNKIGKTFQEYMADPELLKATFINVSDIVSRMIVEKL